MSPHVLYNQLSVNSPLCENVTSSTKPETHKSKKVKVAHTRLPSVRFRSWSRFLAVSLQVMWVINPAVGCHYFPPGPQLPSQPLRHCYQFRWLVNRGTMGVNSLTKTVNPTASRLRSEPGPFCAWVQHANHSATEPAHNVWVWQHNVRGDTNAVTTTLPENLEFWRVLFETRQRTNTHNGRTCIPKTQDVLTCRQNRTEPRPKA